MPYVPASKQLGGVEVSLNGDSTRYQAKFFVMEADLSKFMPEIGDQASWATESCCVSSVSKSWYGPGCWIVSVTAEPDDGSFLSRKQSLGDFISKSYSLQDLHMPSSWWGAWQASASDAPQFDADGKLSNGERRFLNVNGDWSRPGDLIFSSALPYEIDSKGNIKLGKGDASAGTADYSSSPFQAPESIPLSLAGQTVKVKRYNCSFYTKRLAKNISDFVGVNGEFSGDCRPLDAEAGRWKAISQSVENVRDANGKEWTHLRRGMLQAPLALKWDPDKNGGIWKW